MDGYARELKRLRDGWIRQGAKEAKRWMDTARSKRG